MTTRRSVRVKGDGVPCEALASGSITPGHLVELTSATQDTVKVHATAAGEAQRAFAVEDDLQGNDIDDVYSSGANVLYAIFNRGDEVYAILATGQTVTKGDKLESAGNGQLRKLTNGVAVAIAKESVTTTAAVARIVAEVL